MSRILFLLNDQDEFNFSDLVGKYLADWKVDVATEMPKNASEYKLIVPWNYRKIIKDIPDPNNIVIFHSSDLPEGKGWAPIYYAIAEERADHVISGVLAAPSVDSGDVVIKARIRIQPDYTASILRRFDAELSILAARKILERFRTGNIHGVPQTGPGSYRTRRSPDDNKIDVTRSFSDLIPHLRACEPSAPAFFYFQGARYTIVLHPTATPAFPKDVDFFFPQDGSSANENWRRLGE